MKESVGLVLRFVWYVAVVYGLLVLVTYLLQRRMLYLPDVQTPSASQINQYGLSFWPANNGYRGFTSRMVINNPKGVIIVFHGNAGAAWNRSYYIAALEPLGYRVVLAEYPGYGGRSGTLDEKSFVTDARETIQQVYEESGGPIFLWGESLGGGVVAAVAANPPVPLSGVIMLAPWDSLPELAQALYWYLPARWLVHQKYNNVQNLRAFESPVAVIMMENDDIIPSRHSRRLYESLEGTKKLWILKGVGHNSWPISPSLAWWREVMSFVSESRHNQ